MTTLQQKWESIKVLIDQNSVSPENLAEEVLQDKLRFQKVSLDQTIELIRERETTKQRNVSSIESEIIQVQKDLFPHKCIRYPIMPDSRRKGSLEKALSDLEDRRRDEITNCWKDTLKLWQQLLEIAVEYRAIGRKNRILFPTDENGID
jgi:hypothetical protein